MEALYVYILYLIALAQGSYSDNKEEKTLSYVPDPQPLQLIPLAEPGFIAKWTSVESSNKSDPILGYNLKVWEQQRKNATRNAFVGGVYKEVDVQTLIEFPVTFQILDWQPWIFKVPASETSVEVEHLKRGLMYEGRVQAYTKEGVGPLSHAMRIKFGL